MTAPTAPREHCYRCFRPRTRCLCASVPSIPTRTRIVVLQHPHERTHPFGTARFVKLGLPNAEVHTILGGNARDLNCPVDVADDAVLLYPHPDAEDLAGLGPEDRPSTLVLLDGTWSHSRQLYRANPWLQRLRHVRITPAAPSRYRIRAEPKPDYLSTLEAIVTALSALEPEVDCAPLLAAFDGMVDGQLDHRATRPRQVRRKRPRQKPSRRISPLVRDPGLVVIYAESSMPGSEPGTDRELVQLVAARRDGGAVCEVILQPRKAPPSEGHLRHMGLSAAGLAAGCALDEAADRLRAFVGDDPIAAWTQSSLSWAAPLLPPDAATTLLKTSYCNLRRRRAGFLDDVLAREGHAPRPVTCRGRAAGRLAGALAVACWLRGEDDGAPSCG